MSPRRILALAVVGLCAAVAVAGETVGVNGSNTTYAATIESKVADKPVKLTLTGTALRKRKAGTVEVSAPDTAPKKK